MMVSYLNTVPVCFSIFVYHPGPSDMIFDPDQDPEEKRVVRQNYRSLAKKIEGMQIFISLLSLIEIPLPLLYRKSRESK